MFNVGDIVVGRKEGWDLDGATGKVVRQTDYAGTVMVNFEKHGSYHVSQDILILKQTYNRMNKLNKLLNNV